MDLSADERLSDSPYIERVWYSQSDYASPFTSIAQMNWEMVITKHQGKTSLTIRGPETIATPAYRPADAEWFGIQFKPGAFMPDLPAKQTMNRADVTIPQSSPNTFWLKCGAWEFFDFENAEQFVARLVHEELLTFDPLVPAVIHQQPLKNVTLRTIQRRFLQATGLTQGTFFQIKRARYATSLLKEGVSILDTVHLAGYADQPHLTRSLKHYIGQTPAQISYEGRMEKLSLLFKTTPF